MLIIPLTDTTTDTNNNKKNLPIPLPSPAKAKKQFMKERDLAEFAKLYYARYNQDQICATLKIHHTTYYRYLHELADQQREHLQVHGEDEMWATIGKTRHALNFVASDCIKKIVNKENKYSEDAELAAANLLCEVQSAELRLLSEGPITTLRELPIHVKRKLITNKDGEMISEEEIEYESGTQEDIRDSSGS